jgi:lysophospholipase L1-like esterase
MEDYKKNLVKIITHPNVKSHNAKVLLVTPPPLDEIRVTVLDKAIGHKEACRQAAVSAAFSQTARDVASEVPGVILVDLQKAIMDKAISMTPDYDPNGLPLGYPEGGKRGALEQLLPDGLHMSGEAYKVFFNIVAPHIGPFPAQPGGYVYPDWRTMNPGTL